MPCAVSVVCYAGAKTNSQHLSPRAMQVVSSHFMGFPSRAVSAPLTPSLSKFPLPLMVTLSFSFVTSSNLNHPRAW